MNRLRVGLIAVAVFGWLIITQGCASSRSIPFDGVTISDDPVLTLIPVTILNTRIRDAIDPHFYLVSNGRHALGIVKGFGERRTVFVDTRWIRSDGAVTIIAHYPGGGDFVYDQFTWLPGLTIDVSLDDIFNPVSAWAHR